MIKHDSLEKALFDDEALSRQQNLNDWSRFTSHKVYLLSCPRAHKLPGDILVDAGLLYNKTAVVYCLLYTCHH